MIENVDFMCANADSYTIDIAQTLISWWRIKIALERERNTIGMVWCPLLEFDVLLKAKGGAGMSGLREEISREYIMCTSMTL